MSRKITLIRHGQAGDRIVYDRLSPLGVEQAQALGSWFASQGTRFDLLVAGSLNRQQDTARAIVAATENGAIFTDARWDEFDLDAVYRGLAPQLCLEDEQFRLEYEELQRDMKDPDHAVHRAWRNCDTTAVKAWVGGRHRFDGESFEEFLQRIAAAFAGLPDAGSVAVVTSATPIGLCCGKALDLSPIRVMNMAGALQNTAFSEFHVSTNGLRLFSFNNTPHLNETQRTHR